MYFLGIISHNHYSLFNYIYDYKKSSAILLSFFCRMVYRLFDINLSCLDNAVSVNCLDDVDAAYGSRYCYATDCVVCC